MWEGIDEKKSSPVGFPAKFRTAAFLPGSTTISRNLASHSEDRHASVCVLTDLLRFYRSQFMAAQACGTGKGEYIRVVFLEKP